MLLYLFDGCSLFFLIGDIDEQYDDCLFTDEIIYSVTFILEFSEPKGILTVSRC